MIAPSCTPLYSYQQSARVKGESLRLVDWRQARHQSRLAQCWAICQIGLLSEHNMCTSRNQSHLMTPGLDEKPNLTVS